jgi:hypothetical protein
MGVKIKNRILSTIITVKKEGGPFQTTFFWQQVARGVV